MVGRIRPRPWLKKGSQYGNQLALLRPSVQLFPYQDYDPARHGPCYQVTVDGLLVGTVFLEKERGLFAYQINRRPVGSSGFQTLETATEAMVLKFL
jgi:hypothetical protein